jgi:hypothetical protein
VSETTTFKLIPRIHNNTKEYGIPLYPLPDLPEGEGIILGLLEDIS